MKKRYRIGSVMLLLTIFLAAVYPVSAAKKSYIKLSSSTKLYVLKGKKSKIKAKATGRKKKITFKISNKKIASVTSKGTVRGKKYGSATIYIRAKGLKTKKVKVYVRNPVTGLRLISPTHVTFSGVGKRSQIKASVTPSKKIITKKVFYSSSNKKIAAVSKSGKITAKGPGKTTITVSTSPKAGKVYKKKIQVYVNIPVVSISARDISIKEWQSKDVGAVVLPLNATTKSLSYASSNNNVAIVSGEGVVTGINEGTAKITVKAMDNVVHPKVKTINVYVSKGSYQWPEGVNKTYENNKTCFTLQPGKIKKTEVLFRSCTGKIYSYTIKDIEGDFKKLESAGISTEEEKNGVKITKINSSTFRFVLKETRESYHVSVAYRQYRLYIKGDFTNGEKIRFNKVY